MSTISFESSAGSLSQTNIDENYQLSESESRDQRSKSIQNEEKAEEEEEEEEGEQNQDKEEEDYDRENKTTTKKKNMPDIGQPVQTSTGNRKRNLIIACVGVTTVVAIIIAVIVFMNTGNTDENNIEKSALKITAKTSEATTLKSMTTHPTSTTTTMQLKKRNTTQTTAQTSDNIIIKILKQYSTILPTPPICSKMVVCDDTAMDATTTKILNVKNCATVHNLINITKIAVSPHPIKIAEVFRMSVEADILAKIESPVKAKATGTVNFLGSRSDSWNTSDLCPLISNTCNTDNGNSAAHCPTCPLDVGVFTTQLKIDLRNSNMTIPPIVRLFRGNIDLKIEVTNAGRSGCVEFTIEKAFG